MKIVLLLSGQNKQKVMAVKKSIRKYNKNKKEQFPLKNEIVKTIDSKGMKYSFIAAKLKVSASHLHFMLKSRDSNCRPLTQEDLDGINAILETEFKLP